jgi:hypothetical protein
LVTKRKKSGVRLIAGEPSGEAISYINPDYKIALINALNWYNREKTSKDAVLYIKEWALAQGDKSGVIAVEKTNKSIPSSFGWVARLLSTGAVLDPKEELRLKAFIASLAKEQIVVAAPKAGPRVSIQDSIKEKANELLGEFEGLLDDLSTGNLPSNFSVKAFLTGKQVGAPYVPYIDTWAKRKIAEYLPVLKGGDPYLKEAYSNYKKRDLMDLLNFLKSVVEEAQTYAAVKKANRAPRTKKAVPAGVQIRSLKYLKKFPELGLESVSPVDVVGAQQLWVYNTKNRKLGVYKTDTHKGLTVKGTTVQGYVPEESMQKTLRKPEAVLKSVIEGGKITLRRVLENVNAKESPLNGRINEDIILLRVVR